MGQPGVRIQWDGGQGAGTQCPGQAFLRPPSVFILPLGFPDGKGSVAMTHTGGSGRLSPRSPEREARGPSGVIVDPGGEKESGGHWGPGLERLPLPGASSHPRVNQRLWKGP